MKSLYFVCTFLVLVCLSHQKTKFENCDEKRIEEMKAANPKYDDSCMIVRCDGPGRSMALTCPAYTCMEEKGFKEDDNTKVYPECCGGPICD